MKLVIIDDERLARVELRRLLTDHPEVQNGRGSRWGRGAGSYG